MREDADSILVCTGDERHAAERVCADAVIASVGTDTVLVEVVAHRLATAEQHKLARVGPQRAAQHCGVGLGVLHGVVGTVRIVVTACTSQKSEPPG